MNSWTTVDTQIGFDPHWNGFASGLGFRLSVQNLFDQAPPYLAPDSTSTLGGAGYDSTNYSPLGRFISLRAVKSW